MLRIKYGGKCLLYETPEVEEFFDQRLPVSDWRAWAPPLDHTLSVNYPAPPQPAINQLYWPTGASRWATCYLLCDNKVKDELTAEAEKNRDGIVSRSATLQLEFGETLIADMHLLPPRRASAVTGERANPLWILPLVDDRYWWQFQDTGEIALTTSTTWAALYDLIEAELGVTIVDETVDADYQIPDPYGPLKEQYANVASLLDAVAHSAGQRIVVDLDGVVRAMGWTTSQQRVDDNLERLTDISAGGQFTVEGGHVPAVCRVSFPKAHAFIPDIDGGRYSYDVAPGSAFPTSAIIPGTAKRVESRAYADFTTGGGTPDNNTALDALADRIGLDFYDSLSRQYHAALNGWAEWNPSGFDDAVIWNLGRLRTQDNGGGQEVSTRVQSAPPNLGVAQMLNQDDALTIFDETIKQAKPDSTITAGSSGTFSIYEDGTDTTKNVTGHLDWAEGGEDMTSGKEAFLRFFHDRKEWVVIGAECE